MDKDFFEDFTVGDTIHLVVEMTELIAKNGGQGVVMAKNEIRNALGEPVCVYTSRILCGRRPGAVS